MLIYSESFVKLNAFVDRVKLGSIDFRHGLLVPFIEVKNITPEKVLQAILAGIIPDLIGDDETLTEKVLLNCHEYLLRYLTDVETVYISVQDMITMIEEFMDTLGIEYPGFEPEPEIPEDPELP